MARVYPRFEAALRDIAAANAGKTVAVFAHGSVLRAFQQRLLGSENVPYCDNTSVSRLTVEDGTFRIDFLNDASHLTPDISTFERQKWWRKAENRSDFNMWYPRDRPGCLTPSCTIRSWAMFQRRFPPDTGGNHRAGCWSRPIRGRRLGGSSSAVPSVISAPRARTPDRAAPAGHSARGFFRYFGFAEQGSDTLERSIKVPKIQMVKTAHPPIWRMAQCYRAAAVPVHHAASRVEPLVPMWPVVPLYVWPFVAVIGLTIRAVVVRPAVYQVPLVRPAVCSASARPVVCFRCTSGRLGSAACGHSYYCRSGRPCRCNRVIVVRPVPHGHRRLWSIRCRTSRSG